MLAAFWGLFISVVFMAGINSFSISGALLTVLFVLLLEFGGVLLTARDRVDGYVPFVVALWATGIACIGLSRYFLCHWTHSCR